MPDPSMAVSAHLHPVSEHQSENNVAWQRFSVPFEYPVHFTDQLFLSDNQALVDCITRLEPETTHRLIVFVDNGLLEARPHLPQNIVDYASHHASRIDLVCAPISMPGGEQIKNHQQYIEQMQRVLAEKRIDRHSFVMAIGGGALLDAAGLVAATSHRGIRHIRVPTTVLAQNDSGVGVKNSINLFGQKNYLGTFAPPYAVINDYDFIRSLGARDKIAGIAEAVKVALIRDVRFYRWLEQNTDKLTSFEAPAMQYMIRRCAELHMLQIANGGDPFETGSARPLDYGHWVAHKLESLTNYELRHGEAVAIGLALDTHYSVRCGLLEPGQDERVCKLLTNLGFTLWHNALDYRHDNNELSVIDGMRDFREHLGGELTITLLNDIGVGVEVHQMDDTLIEQCIAWLKQRCSS